MNYYERVGATRNWLFTLTHTPLATGIEIPMDLTNLAVTLHITRGNDTVDYVTGGVDGVLTKTDEENGQITLTPPDGSFWVEGAYQFVFELIDNSGFIIFFPDVDANQQLRFIITL